MVVLAQPGTPLFGNQDRCLSAGAAVRLSTTLDLIPPPVPRPSSISSLAKQALALERISAARAAAVQQLNAVKVEQALKKGVANLRKDGTPGDAFSAAVRVRLDTMRASCQSMTAACALHQLIAVKAQQAFRKDVANSCKDGTAGDAFSAAVRACLQVV